MGKLQAIDISRVHAVRTDDWSEDQVYVIASVACSDGSDPDGHHPGTFVPISTRPGVTHQSGTLIVPQGVLVTPPTAWGRIFPTTIEHRDNCCKDPELPFVTAKVYLFDSDNGDWSFQRIFGVVLIALASLGIAIGVAVMIGGFPLGAFAGAAAGLISGALLSLLWKRFLDASAEDEFLGGIRETFECEHGAATKEVTRTLIGASAGIRSDSAAGRRAKVWDSSSAEYSVTFTARYG